MKSFYWLLRRELWEHRSFLIVPIIMGIAAVFFMLLGMLRMTGHMDGMEHIGQHFPLADLAPEKRHAAARTGVMITAMPFNVVMLILIAAYLLDSLYGERRDRSILFWKSLPITDTSVVLSKLATATLVAPLITLAVVAVSQLTVLTLASVLFLMLGVGGWAWMWNPVGWLLGWASLGYGYLLLCAMLLPYMAWLLLASAWARRAPLLWAAVPPVALIILEHWFLGSSHLGRLIFGHIRNLLPATFQFVPHLQHDNGMIIQPGTAFFAQLAVWSGIFTAAMLVAAAVWLRRYRDET